MLDDHQCSHGTSDKNVSIEPNMKEEGKCENCKFVCFGIKIQILMVMTCVVSFN